MDYLSEEKYIKFIINGIEYKVSLHLWVSDYTYFMDYLKNGTGNYEEAIATILLKHIGPEEQINISDIICEPLVLEQYIKGLVDTNKELNLSYKKFENEENVKVRFMLAVDDVVHEMTSTMSDALSDMVNAIKLSLPKPKLIIDTIQKVLESTVSISKKIGEMVVGVNNLLQDVVKNINIPKITEERKNEIITSCEMWGNLGWTILPNADVELFFFKPKNIEEANSLALNFCDKKSMQELFVLTKNIKGVKIEDFEEAIYSFDNRKYKSCAMILVSLLDAKLIRMQRNADRKSNGQRSSGLGAIKKIEKRILSEQDINKKFSLLLSYTNLFACLKVVFADGEDFKKQPKIVNRNFIEHGMLTRKVRKRDCIQLFLLYYNFLSFFDVVYN